MRRLAVVLLVLAACGAPTDMTPYAAAPVQYDAASLHVPTTTTVPARPAVTQRASRSRVTVPPRRPVPPSAGPGRAVAPQGDIFDALARCESGGNPRAVGGGGRYFGAFQFMLSTWRSLGYSGNPVDHDYATQKTAAQRLVARSGWGQFPVCSRRIGAR